MDSYGENVMYTKIERNDIQKLELDILRNFIEFARFNHLTVFLSGGTLLGAVRHKGFIPWDDDIDVCMPRKDYDFFVHNYNGWSDHLEVRSNLLNNFGAPFSKIVDLRTEIDHRFTEDGIDKHLWIDVFPVDGLPEDVTLVGQIYKKCSFYRKILLLCKAKLGEGKSVLRKYSKYILKPMASIYGEQRCINKIESIAAQYPYDEYKYVGVITWGLYGVGERMLKSEFEQAVEVEFEGHKFPTFSCWDSYLRGLYGDYMQLPPVEKRKTHDMVAYLIDEDE